MLQLFLDLGNTGRQEFGHRLRGLYSCHARNELAKRLYCIGLGIGHSVFMEEI